MKYAEKIYARRRKARLNRERQARYYAKIKAKKATETVATAHAARIQRNNVKRSEDLAELRIRVDALELENKLLGMRAEDLEKEKLKIETEYEEMKD